MASAGGWTRRWKLLQGRFAPMQYSTRVRGSLESLVRSTVAQKSSGLGRQHSSSGGSSRAASEWVRRSCKCELRLVAGARRDRNRDCQRTTILRYSETKGVVAVGVRSNVRNKKNNHSCMFRQDDGSEKEKKNDSEATEIPEAIYQSNGGIRPG